MLRLEASITIDNFFKSKKFLSILCKKSILSLYFDQIKAETMAMAEINVMAIDY